MTPPELPEDPKKWPSDPFALLGLERGAAAIEIKRAYTRLIRKYKPEHAPDEFRRIREAYEACTAQSHWFFEPHFTAGSQVPPEERPTVEVPVLTRSPVQEDETTRLWSLAVAGQLQDAYAPLARLAEQEPERVDLPLRLYWLLALEPELDAWRTRLDWLIEGLKRSRLSGPAVELYRRELSVDPDVALYGPFISLLKLDASAFDKLNVARMRLLAGGRSQSWNVIAADVQELAKTLPQANESAWLSYIVSAFDWAAWDRPMPLYAILREEARKMQHLELSQGFYFDRMEEVEHATRDFIESTVTRISAAWIRLVPLAWANGGSLDVADVRPAASEIAADPSQGLLRFDRLQRDLGPIIPIILTRAFDQLYYRRGTHSAEFPAEWIRALATRLAGGWHRGYDQLRDDLLNFLLENAIHPDEFVAACEADPESRVRDRMTSLRSDLSLKLVWLACTLAA